MCKRHWVPNQNRHDNCHCPFAYPRIEECKDVFLVMNKAKSLEKWSSITFIQMNGNYAKLYQKQFISMNKANYFHLKLFQCPLNWPWIPGAVITSFLELQPISTVLSIGVAFAIQKLSSKDWAWTKQIVVLKLNLCVFGAVFIMHQLARWASILLIVSNACHLLFKKWPLFAVRTWLIGYLQDKKNFSSNFSIALMSCPRNLC